MRSRIRPPCTLPSVLQNSRSSIAVKLEGPQDNDAGLRLKLKGLHEPEPSSCISLVAIVGCTRPRPRYNFCRVNPVPIRRRSGTRDEIELRSDMRGRGQVGAGLLGEWTEPLCACVDYGRRSAEGDSGAHNPHAGFGPDCPIRRRRPTMTAPHYGLTLPISLSSPGSPSEAGGR